MPLILRLGAALLGGALAFAGTVAPAATPDTSPAATSGLPTNVTLAFPLTAPSSETGVLSAEELETLTSPAGELTRQLNAVLDRPVAIGVDPMIAASIRILGTSAPESALTWLERLEGATNETFALGYADADVAGLSQAGATSIPVPTAFDIDPGLFPEAEEPVDGEDGEGSADEEEPTVTPSPSAPVEPAIPTLENLLDLPYSLDSIVWPRDNTVVAADLAVFAASGATTTIVSSGNVSYSRDAVPASAAVGDSRLLVSNTDISALLRAAGSAVTDAAWQQAMSELTLALAGWTGGDSVVLATFDRTVPSSLNRIAQTIDTLAATPDTNVTSLRATLAQEPVAVGLLDSPLPAERTAALRAMLEAEPAIAAFATVLDDPGVLTSERRLALLALASNSWVPTPELWAEAIAADQTLTAAILASVRVEETSTLNLRSFTGNLPFTVSNSLPYPVTVYVTVSANTAILDVLETRVPVVVEPESQARAFIPVQSIANGDVSLQVSLTSGSNVPISTPLFATANVQAEWETAFTLTVAIIVVLVFVFGIIRTIRRRRRERAARADASASGTDTAPADTATPDAAAAGPAAAEPEVK